MADLLALSSRIIDTGEAPGPVNRITHELSEIAGGVAMVEAFSHSVLFKTDDGLVVFDTSGAQGGKLVVDAIRSGRRIASTRSSIPTATSTTSADVAHFSPTRQPVTHRGRPLPVTKTSRAASTAMT